MLVQISYDNKNYNNNNTFLPIILKNTGNFLLFTSQSTIYRCNLVPETSSVKIEALLLLLKVTLENTRFYENKYVYYYIFKVGNFI